MPGAAEPLADFLDREFPGLTLDRVTARRTPWPKLRFELAPGIPDSEPLKRVEQSTKTAALIFERIFRPEDDGLLSIVRWRDHDDAVFLQMLPPGCRPVRSEGRAFWREDEEDEGEYVTYSASLRPRSVDYRSMFELIAGGDFPSSRPRGFSLDGYVYFAKTSEPVLFHMYDDRGAVVLASKPESIDDLRDQFDDWIIP